MSEKPLDLIEKYLERVRVYLPIDSEDVLIEIRTHLLEEAETIGDGNITRGSVMMAIERFGDPKDAANAAAGTGQKVGPVPEEYTQPLIRMIFVLAALVSAFAIGAVVIRLTIPDFLNIATWSPLNILTVILNVIFFTAIIIAAIFVLTRDRAPTEKTAIEEFLDIGTTVIKPKPRLDAFGDIFFGVLFGIALMLPQVHIMLSESFLAVVPVVIVLFLLGAVVGVSFFLYGENNLNLALETVLSVAWIFMCIVFINIGWPFEAYWQYTDGIGWILKKQNSTKIC